MPISRLSQPPASAVQDAHDHGAATGSATLVVHETFIKAEAPATSKGTIAADAATASASSQPSHPCTLDVTFDASWDGGDVTITGKSPSGGVQTETFTGGDGVTRTGVKAFALIDADGIACAGSGTNTYSATVKVGASLGLATTGGTVRKLSVDGADDTIAASSSTYGTVTPTTAPNGSKAIEVWYTVAHTHTIAAATPTITVS